MVTGPTLGEAAVENGKQLKLVTSGLEVAITVTHRLYDEPSDKSSIGLIDTKLFEDLVTLSGKVDDSEPADHTYKKSSKPVAEADAKNLLSIAGMTAPNDVIVVHVNVTFGIGVEENLTF